MKVTAFTPAIVWLIFVTVLLCLPGSTLPTLPFLAIIHPDKWIHIILFCLLCLLFSHPFHKSNLPGNSLVKCFLLITVLGIFYGTMMEFVQKYCIPNRSFELWDIVADSVGCLLAFVISFKKYRQGGKKLVPMEIGTATKTNCL